MFIITRASSCGKYSAVSARSMCTLESHVMKTILLFMKVDLEFL